MTPFISDSEPKEYGGSRQAPPNNWPPPKKRRGAAVMDEAARIINGERNEQYGEPEDNFRNIAEMWNAYLRARYGFYGLDPYDTAMMMVLLKVARNGHFRKFDNLVDLVGYAAHAGDLDALQK